MAGLVNGSAAGNVSPFPTAMSDQQVASPSNGNLIRVGEPVPDVYRAICEVAKAISRDGIGKGARNQQQGFAYRGIDDVQNALSSLLAGADLCILPRMISRVQEERATAKGGVLFYVTVQADFDFVSARDGSRHTITMYGEAMDSADKATNKAMSAAYKYACLQVFCIPTLPTEGMQDADATTPQPAPKPPAPAVAPKPGTQAAADLVAAQKIAAGKTRPEALEPQPAPWVNRGTMRECFSRIRERVGEMIYLEAISKYGAIGGRISPLNWPNQTAALECYHCLVAAAVQEVA